MPLYDYECPSCGRTQERFDYIGKRRQRMRCKCGGWQRTIISTQAKPMIYDGYDEGLGANVTGYRQRQRLMKELGISER